jgi:unsaturated chondroitin disaccharide hydrolase
MKNYNEILAENKAWAEETFAKIDKKMSAMTIRSRSKIPDGVDADGFHVEKSIDWWTNGFWGGLNWLLYDYTKNEEYLKTAKEQEILMDEALKHYEKLHHDVGFMWHLLSGASYRLTGDTASRTRNLFAAATLAGRWGDPEDLAGPAVFLASTASDFVNGQILYVDGGIQAYFGKQP